MAHMFKTAQEFIVKKYGVDIHDYIANESHPLHPVAMVAQHAARDLHHANQREAEMHGRMKENGHTYSASSLAVRAHDLAQIEGQQAALKEILEHVMSYLKPSK